MINKRLLDYYSVDIKKNLNVNGYCSRPFDTLLVNSRGSCFICECESWLPVSVGNIQAQSIEKILQSNAVKTIQQSILDGSYRYCNHRQCSYLLDDRKGAPFFPKNNTPKVLIKNIRLAIDDSCNLSCPSCRTKTKFVKSGMEFQRRLLYAKKIINYLEKQQHPICVHIGSDGDPFASLIYRYFIKKSSQLPNIRYTIQTNGLLLKKMFQKNRTLFNKLDVLNVSVDGATKKTYEKLRRGGKFDSIIDNLKFIAEKKKHYSFALRLHYVVQAQNYKEMPDMIELAAKVNADRLFFNKITDWNTYTNFHQEDISNINHSEHPNYKKIIQTVREIIKTKDKNFVYMPTLGHNEKTI